MKYPNPLEVLLLTLLFLNGSMKAFGENYTSLKNSQSQFDSNLEHIDVKRKTGFDGKVRAVRFFEPEHIDFLQKEQEVASVKATTSRRLLKSNEKRRSSNVTKFLEPDSPIKESLKTKRSIDKKTSTNELHDLQTDEAKVFRPLFVYRQQVAKRLKLKNDRRVAGSEKNPRANQIPNNYYYHPLPYYYQRYFYSPYDKVYF